MNQAKTLAGVVTSQTNNEASFSEEVENNISNSTLSVKERIELFEKGTKQEPDLNTECKLASLNVISNSSDSSITAKIDEAGADFSVSCSSLVLDDGKDIEDEFNAVCEANGIRYNGGYSPDQFNVAFSTSSNYQTYNTIDVHEEDRKSWDKSKSLTLTTLALYQSSLWLFEACSCKPAPRGPPSSTAQLLHLVCPFMNILCVSTAHCLLAF
ncbi:hypothetical protein MWH06_01705 [Wolbachia pipientis]|nr:hypothetical protein MWH06_01705 [Wolbachia pipientis]